MGISARVGIDYLSIRIRNRYADGADFAPSQIGFT